jgi:hypothetical protein
MGNWPTQQMDHVTNEDVMKNLCHGIVVNRFKSPATTHIKNKILAALCYAYDTKLAELAIYSGCSHRSMQRYIYNAKVPSPLIAKKMAFYFNISVYDLFGPYSRAISHRLRKVLREEKLVHKFSEKMNNVNIGNYLLFGLVYVYQLNSQTIADELGVSIKTIQRILYTDMNVSKPCKKSISKLFCIPEKLLFENDFRSRKNNIIM